MISLVVILTPLSGRSPSSTRCCKRSGRAQAKVVLRFWTIASIAYLCLVFVTRNKFLFTFIIWEGQSNFKSTPHLRNHLFTYTFYIGLFFLARRQLDSIVETYPISFGHSIKYCMWNRFPYQFVNTFLSLVLGIGLSKPSSERALSHAYQC
jgi:hypothetical protein